MSDPYIGEIRMFGGNFAPVGWALCNGQLLSISENDLLFSLIGTTYGGDGRSTFALPNLQGRIPIHAGHGQGLGPRVLGEMGGVETVSLTPGQVSAHNHAFSASTDRAGSVDPAGNVLASAPDISLYRKGSAARPLGPDTIAASPGNNQPHENMQPFLCVSFIIALQGVYPPQP
ncbi:phage tail protein [Nitrolancea hollandica]|uniref:Phage Tail Collar n=1 Tax=Nitrolancea hollandica Lb TaxID=1129897 RepID=I4EE50_9BACT|nr:tail fiber protein [Nitrolancea hollandica]CCF82962.1 Phage Tail Collar [Nitrolancea hollandica Lb]